MKKQGQHVNKESHLSAKKLPPIQVSGRKIPAFVLAQPEHDGVESELHSRIIKLPPISPRQCQSHVPVDSINNKYGSKSQLYKMPSVTSNWVEPSSWSNIETTQDVDDSRMEEYDKAIDHEKEKEIYKKQLYDEYHTRNPHASNTNILRSVETDTLLDIDVYCKKLLPPIKLEEERKKAFRKKVNTERRQILNRHWKPTTSYDHYFLSVNYGTTDENYNANNTQNEKPDEIGSKKKKKRYILRMDYCNKADLDFRPYRERRNELCDIMLDSFMASNPNRRNAITVELDKISTGELVLFCETLTLMNALKSIF